MHAHAGTTAGAPASGIRASSGSGVVGTGANVRACRPRIRIVPAAMKSHHVHAGGRVEAVREVVATLTDREVWDGPQRVGDRVAGGGWATASWSRYAGASSRARSGPGSRSRYAACAAVPARSSASNGVERIACHINEAAQGVHLPAAHVVGGATAQRRPADHRQLQNGRSRARCVHDHVRPATVTSCRLRCRGDGRNE